MRPILKFDFVLRYGLLATILLSGTNLFAQTPDLRASQFLKSSNESTLEFPPVGYLSERNSSGEGLKQANHVAPQSFSLTASATGESPVKNSTLTSTFGQWKELAVQKFSKLFGTQSSSSPDFKRVFASLAIVVGGYFALVWISRMISPQRNSQLPNDVVEVLGKTPFNAKQNLQLVRLGNKLILMLEGNEIVQPIAEISDPVEVHQVLNLCESRYRNRNKRLSNASLSPAVPKLAPVNRNSLVGDASNDPGQATLADFVRIIETATRQNVTRRASYEG